MAAAAAGWVLLAALAGCGEPASSGGLGQAGTGGLASSGSGSGASSNAGTSGAGHGGAGGLAGASSQAGSAPAAAGFGGGGAESGGAGGAPAGLVPRFVAQGHQGRLTVSCDDGLSFPYDHSADDAYPCFADAAHDCDHSALAGRGLAYGAGAFVATWGWGEPGTLQRSADGFTWSDVMTETPTFADVAYGHGRFVACANPTRISDDGVEWRSGGELTFDFNYRGIEFVPAGGGTFIVVGESNESRAIAYSPDGVSWNEPTQRPVLCGQALRGMAGNDAVTLIASAQGHACFSKDAGKTWDLVQVTDSFSSPPLWTGSEFMIYSGGTAWSSAEGELWSSQRVEPDGISIGPLSRSDAGTFVAANDGWQVWYEQQQLFRSTDGLHWDVLDTTLFTGSHPIYFIDFGYVEPSASGCAP